ncbi:hypothetical protein M6D81_12360 [Paenibacillus sp. J5C_2022]|nr:hypothetical protein [Paenibacillus sp. J5C2022]MCU6709497.1 hypothetical protein [Paenibacillus sp. J5C2022]
MMDVNMTSWRSNKERRMKLFQVFPCKLNRGCHEDKFAPWRVIWKA